MRFQQKQQIEREQRRVELQTTTRATSQDSLDTPLNDVEPNANNGKVRQMFVERRRGAGIDRSNPLKPIAVASMSTTTTTTTMTKVKGMMATSSTTVAADTAAAIANGRRTRPLAQAPTDFNRSTTSLNNATATITTTMSTGQQRQRVTTNGNARTTHNNTRTGRNDAIANAVSSLSLNDNNNNNPGSLAKSSRAAKLNPVITKKSPVVGHTTTTTPSRHVVDSAGKQRTVSGGNLSNRQQSPVANNITKTKSTVPKISMSVKPPPREITTPPEGTSKCKFCGRTFISDRLLKHEKVCQKMASTKRKIFDAAKQRVKGTESEQFVKKRAAPQRSSSNYRSAAQQYGLNTGVKKNNWRIKHEDFIKTIRAAKKMQAHLASGGKLSDLPPPPPSENPDYIQCPHCGRRFNQQAAERHIPKCATMLHNKPKPGAKNAKR